MIFRFLRAVRHANLFFFSSYSSNSRDSSANDVYASGPETSSSPRLFLGKKQTTTKWILCSFLKSPFYCPFPICSLHFIKTPGLREFILYKSFFIWMQSDSRESKKKHPPKSCPVTLIYFPSFHSSLLLPIISKFVYTHLRNVLEPMTCCPFFFPPPVRNARSYMIM